MSALLAHAKAAHIMGDAFEGQAGHRTDSDAALMLMSIATAYRVAAGVMEAEIRAEAEALNAPCSLDHSRLVGKCLACGATRAAL